MPKGAFKVLRRLAELSWDEVAQLDRDVPWLLPIAATEQHGKHLPLGTDDIILEEALNALMQSGAVEGDLLRLPGVHYGNSHEHLRFPGTVSLACATLVKLVEDVLECMHSQGFTRLVLVNSHGGNTALLEAYAQEWAGRFGVRIYGAHFWASDFFADAQSLLQTPLARDIHAGEAETSLLLYLRPALVRTQAIAPQFDCPVALPPYRPGWLTHELSPETGAMGAPSLASAETGKRLFAYLCDKLAGALRAIAANPA